MFRGGVYRRRASRRFTKATEENSNSLIIRIWRSNPLSSLLLCAYQRISSYRRRKHSVYHLHGWLINILQDTIQQILNKIFRFKSLDLSFKPISYQINIFFLSLTQVVHNEIEIVYLKRWSCYCDYYRFIEIVYLMSPTWASYK